jgi:hypothetical protein
MPVGVTSSIVNVRRLAGAPETRVFRVALQDDPFGLMDGVTVELWDRSCRPVKPSDDVNLENIWEATFRIPARAVWMTVANGYSAWGPGGTYAGQVLSWEMT